jgi:hypothetical protein|tara:strand:+ start:136 stop:531 length:396 start_codon:yes stop_codon:yes gene_type:complete
MIPFIGPIISGIFGVGKQYLSNKAEKAQAKHEQEVAVIKGDQEWDQIQAANSRESWKDEFLTIVITSPFVAMFIASVFGDMGMVERISDSFIILQTNVPEQYWTLLYVAFAASFGVKGVIKGVKTYVDGKK